MNNLQRKIKKNLFFQKIHFVDWITIIFVLIFIVSGILVSVNRYWQYEVFYIDFGEYDQAIWEIAHFQAPMLDHFVHGFTTIFADHFTPSVFLLSPIYWLTSSKEMILYAQSIIVGLSGLVLYFIGKEVIKDRFLSLVILICYFLFVGLQNAVITEFHELTVMTLSFMLTFWAFLKEKRFLFFCFLIITLGFKESTFALGIALGITIYFLNKKWWKESLITIMISSLWGIVSLKIILPYFSHGHYLYTENIPDSFTDKFLALFNSSLKIRTVFFSFLSFGFLPILSFPFWLLMLQDYGPRFETKYGTTRWSLGLHYNAESAVILAVAALFCLHFLLRYKYVVKYKYLLGGLLVFNALFLNRFILHGPFNLVYNPVFYKDTNNFKFLETMLNKIPSNATVATHNDLAAKFTHQRVWLLKKDYEVNNPDYILIDAREGQNPNDFLGSGNVLEILAKLQVDPQYQLIYETKEQFIYKRKT